MVIQPVQTQSASRFAGNLFRTLQQRDRNTLLAKQGEITNILNKRAQMFNLLERHRQRRDAEKAAEAGKGAFGGYGSTGGGAIGAGIGAIFGGPPGAMAGWQIGSQVGGGVEQAVSGDVAGGTSSTMQGVSNLGQRGSNRWFNQANYSLGGGGWPDIGSVQDYTASDWRY